MLKKLNQILESLKIKDFTLKESADLKQFTTMKLGGSGNVLVVKSVETLQELLPLLSKNKIDYRMVGIGANQILSGRDCVYIKLSFSFDREYLEKEHDEYVLPASVSLSLLTSTAKKFNLKKWEYMTGIPASLGGAVYMNAGISTGEICEIVKSVKLVTSQGELKSIKIDESSFSYRENHFVEKGDVIVEVTLKNLGNNPKISNTIENYIENRTKTQPWKDKTCGCVFKNYSKTCRAGHFIDIIGLKGFTYKGIKISHLHGNFFVNMGDASVEDFLKFVKIVQNELYLQYGIQFELEVQLN